MIARMLSHLQSARGGAGGRSWALRAGAASLLPAALCACAPPRLVLAFWGGAQRRRPVGQPVPVHHLQAGQRGGGGPFAVVGGASAGGGVPRLKEGGALHRPPARTRKKPAPASSHMMQRLPCCRQNRSSCMTRAASQAGSRPGFCWRMAAAARSCSSTRRRLCSRISGLFFLGRGRGRAASGRAGRGWSKRAAWSRHGPPPRTILQGRSRLRVEVDMGLLLRRGGAHGEVWAMQLPAETPPQSQRQCVWLAPATWHAAMARS